MSVESWDPRQQSGGLTTACVGELLEAAQADAQDAFGLSTHAIARLASFVRTNPTNDWHAATADLDDAQIEALIRFLTVAEGLLSGWQADAKSPVIPLVSVLKARKAYPPDLNAWIKAHTQNKFLPYGSLMDRL